MNHFIGTWRTDMFCRGALHGDLVICHDVKTNYAYVTLVYKGTVNTNELVTFGLEWNDQPGQKRYDVGKFRLTVVVSDNRNMIEGAYQYLDDLGSFLLVKFNYVDSSKYFLEFHGHPVNDLVRIYHHLKCVHRVRRFIFFAGDSSLDNKYWLLYHRKVNATNGYEDILLPPKTVPDICHWVNHLISEQKQEDFNPCKTAALMTAIEATTLAERENKLLAQDVFIQTHIGENDILLVSVGGNDIALQPSAATICHLASLVLTPKWLLKVNPSFWYFVKLFKNKVESYIENLVKLNKPSKILVSMIYFPCENQDNPSWADKVLKYSGYNRNPQHLQYIIKQLYECATQNIRIDGSQVISIPWFEVLDSTNPSHYEERVEPSIDGGKLMAEHIMQYL